MKNLVLAGLLVAAAPAFAQEIAPRGGSNEYSLNLLVVGSKRYAFEGGASARNDGGGGVGGSLVRNLNNYLAVGADLTFSQFDYRASVAPAAGNAGAGFDTDGNMETIALRLHATWYLLAGPVTPFLTAGVGATFLDPEFGSDPPANACWVYPWYGQVCGAGAPKTTLTRLGYGAGTGLRVDLPRNQGFIRVLVGAEWIDIPEALSTVGYVQLRADFGLRF
ncbi:MAG TPA: hypothetical protein VGX52_05580 [Burkholderiales bacterium]|nr:hypothetical protein [Burkholderiales bacterium]